MSRTHWMNRSRRRLVSILMALAITIGMSATISLTTAVPAYADSASEITAAVNWAEAQMGSTAWDGLCLTFVYDAYLDGGGVNIGGANTAYDYWTGHASAQVTDGSTPPEGALVFWGPDPWSSAGHVTLSLGGGTVISTEERNYTGVHEFTISSRNNAGYAQYYLGWMMPPGVTATSSGSGGGSNTPTLPFPGVATVVDPVSSALSVYAWGGDNNLYTWYQSPSNGYAFVGPQSLGGAASGTLNSEPSAVINPTNRSVSVYATDSNGQLETWYQDPSKGYAFVGPVVLGGSITGQPIAVYITASNTIGVYATGTDGTLQVWWQNPSNGYAFTGPAPFGGKITDAPAVVYDSTHQTVSVYAAGTNGQLYTWYQPSSGSQLAGPTSLGGSISTGPTAVLTPSNDTVSVYATGSDGQLDTWYQVPSNGYAFTGPVPLGGSIMGTPWALLDTANNTVAVYALGTDESLQTWWQDPTKGYEFVGSAGLGGFISTPPSGVCVQVNNTIAVFAGGMNGQLQLWGQSSTSVPVSGPSSLGGAIQ